jgi:hypothetical protein
LPTRLRFGLLASLFFRQWTSFCSGPATGFCFGLAKTGFGSSVEALFYLGCSHVYVLSDSAGWRVSSHPACQENIQGSSIHPWIGYLNECFCARATNFQITIKDGGNQMRSPQLTAQHSQFAGRGCTVRGRFCRFQITRRLVKVTVLNEELSSSLLFIKILAEQRRQEFRGNDLPGGLVRRVNDSRIADSTGE